MGFLSKCIALLSVVFLSNGGLSQFYEDFEGGFPLPGWAIFDNGVGTSTSWTANSTAHTGSGAVFINYDCSVGSNSEDWLVTPMINVSSGDVLTFYHFDESAFDFQGVYEVRISTNSQTNPGDFNTIAYYTETNTHGAYALQYIPLDSFAGQSIYIAFVQTQNCGDAWYIDDVSVAQKTCQVPTNLAVSNITSSSADVTWDQNSATSWDVLVEQTLVQSNLFENVTVNAWTANGLQPSTSYRACVRETCDSSEALVISALFNGGFNAGNPAALELYAIEDIKDLSIYGIGSGTVLTGSDGLEFVFPSMMVPAGSYVYVTNDSSTFASFFGFNADIIDGSVGLDPIGDEAVELYKDSVVIDIYGDMSVTGTNTPWRYKDGWAIRKSSVLNNYGTFNIGNWEVIDDQIGGYTQNSSMPYANQWKYGTYFAYHKKSDYDTVLFATPCSGVLGDVVTTPILVNTIPYQSAISTSACYTNSGGMHPSNDVFYLYVCEDSCVESISISLCGSNFDTYLSVYDVNQNLVASNNDFCGIYSAINGLNVSAGDSLYVVIEGFGSLNGDFLLEIEENYFILGPFIIYDTQDINCYGDSTGFISLGNGDDSYMYQWDDYNMQSDSTATNLPAGTYNVIASSNSGCKIDTSVTIVDLNPPLYTNPNITHVMCFGDTTGSVVLNEGGGAGGPITVDWQGVNPQSLYASTFQYTIQDTLGCSLTDSILVTQGSEIVLTALVQDELLGNDASIDLSVVGGTPPYLYSWNNGGGITEDIINVSGNVTYTVVVTDANGCTASKSIYVASYVGISSSNDEVNIYPNPSRGRCVLNVTNFNADVDLLIYNSNGTLVKSQKITDTKVNVDMSSMSSGVYSLHIRAADRNYITKMIIID